MGRVRPCPSPLLIVDACVLIDFWQTDPGVVSLLARYVGTLHVAASVLAEVDGLDHAAALEAGLHVVEPELDVLAEAAASRRGLSFQDHQCLILTRTHGWVCVTNDGRLRKVCGEDGVDVLWGLEVLALLVEAGGLPGDDAVEFAHQMARFNHFLTSDILARFEARVRGAS